MKENLNTHEQILKSCLVYQFLHNKHLKVFISIDEILEIEPSLGLTGPGDSVLTKILQNTLGMIKLIETHSILHDAFGRFYINNRKGRGYMYAYRSKSTTDIEKRLYYNGQISGLLYCLFRGIRI